MGQGDSILISRGSQQILIDGGPSGQNILEKLGESVPFWDRDIEIICDRLESLESSEKKILQMLRDIQERKSLSAEDLAKAAASQFT